MSLTADLIDSVPDGDLSGNGAGRVLSDSPAAKRARERRAGIKDGRIPAPGGAKPRGRPRKRSGGASRTPRTPKGLYPEISAFLSLVNMAVTMTPFGSKYEPLGTVSMVEIGPGVTLPIPDMKMVKLGDELDDMEIANLAKALDAQCQRSPRFRRYVEMVLGVGAGGGLIAIVGMIGVRRAARHGIIDPSLDAKIGTMMSGDLSALADFMPTAAPDAPTVDETPNADTGEIAPDAAREFAFE